MKNEGTAKVFEGTDEVLEGTAQEYESTAGANLSTAEIYESTAHSLFKISGNTRLLVFGWIWISNASFKGKLTD
ncbi:hypothetical protein Tco_1129015 [Tanacetum coccineum]